jgi:serine/threonine protein kinase
VESKIKWKKMFNSVYAKGSEVELEYGTFVVDERVACGGFSVVYSGTYGDIPAAMKVMTRKYKDFKREVNVLLTLNHPNICQFLDSVQDDCRQMLVTVKCPVDVLDYVAEERLPLPQIKCMLRDFFRGVEYLHSEGVAHLDLKLDNLLLSDCGSVVICDFGFATRRKRSSKKVGTTGYAAPEILKVEELGPYDTFKADIWSAGIVAFSLAHGYLPFESDKCPNYQQFEKHPTLFWAHFGMSELVQFLAWLIHIPPERRPKNVMRHPFLFL